MESNAEIRCRIRKEFAADTTPEGIAKNEWLRQTEVEIIQALQILRKSRDKLRDNGFSLVEACAFCEM